MSEEKKKRTAWQKAAELAEKTPPDRNRYVDFLRAASILVVITGHWLVVAPHINAAGEIILPDILSILPWTQWLTWVVQIMPVFFIVGGFSNSISWKSALKRGESYQSWFSARLRRLIPPVLPVIAFWGIVGIIANLLHADKNILKPASSFALLPAWFLVVYIVIASLIPLVYKAWQRFKMKSFWMLVIAAILTDLIAFALRIKWVGWFNYIFVWVAVHQLGIAWQEGDFKGARKTLLWAVGGIAALIALVTFGPYPVSMVSVQGEEISNTLPPNLTMLALGIFQGGAILSLESPVRKWLNKGKVWTSAILINGMIMTLFLWHVTAMIIIAVLALALGGIGLRIAPGSSVWWLTRPLWVLILATALLSIVPIFLRYERLRPPQNTAPVPLWRSLGGAFLFCFGLASLTLNGVPADNLLGIRIVDLALPFLGTALGAVMRK